MSHIRLKPSAKASVVRSNKTRRPEAYSPEREGCFSPVEPVSDRLRYMPRYAAASAHPQQTWQEPLVCWFFDRTCDGLAIKTDSYSNYIIVIY